MNFINKKNVDKTILEYNFYNQPCNFLKSEYKCIIPCNIYQTWYTKDLPEKMRKRVNLLKSQNIFIYGAIDKGELMAVYIFRRPNLFYDKKEAVECFLTLYNKKLCDVQIFINRFVVSLHKLKQKINNSYLLIEELCDNHIIIDHFINNKNIILDFTSPTAFFLYNYCSYTVNSKKSIIFY